MILTATLPLFALICSGYGLYRTDLPDRAFWPAAEKLNYVLLFPALLVVNLADAPLDDPAILQLGGAAALTILIAAGALWAGRALRPMPAARFGPVLQGTVRFNTYIGLALVASLLSQDGIAIAGVYLAVAVPLVNVLSVIALSGGRGVGIAALLRPIVTNPLILGCAVGIAIALTGLPLPDIATRFLDLLAAASLPLGLLCVGAALRPRSLGGDTVTLLATSALRLLAMPALAVAMAAVLGLPRTEASVLVIFSAIPTAASAYVLTQEMRGDARLMAGLVTLQTMLSVLTIPLVTALIA